MLVAAEKNDGDVVSLPAFVVEGGVSAHWYHAELPGLEILSCYSKSETEKWVSEIARQTRLLDWELPPELKPANGGPLVVILDARPSASLRLSLNAMRDDRGGRGTVIGGAVIDQDYATLYEQRTEPAATPASFIIFSAARAVIDRCPGWDHLSRSIGAAALNVVAAGDGVDLLLFSPPSRKEAKLPLPRLASLFSSTNSETGEFPVASQRETEAWFLRWAMLAHQGEHRPALWKFFREVAAQPHLDDELARRYFGLSLSELDDHVAQFRQSAQAHDIAHLPMPPSAVPAVKVRDATVAEISGVLTQWIVVTERHHPMLASTLIPAARREIARASQARSESPRLVAMHAWLELTEGNTKAARELFESVTPVSLLDPAARFELAQLRYAEFDAGQRSQPPGSNFDALQVASVLTPLAPIPKEPTANAAALSLMLRTWKRAREKPAPGEIAQFVSCVRLLPRAQGLLLETSRFCLELGLTKEAQELAELNRSAAKTDRIRPDFPATGTQDTRRPDAN